MHFKRSSALSGEGRYVPWSMYACRTAGCHLAKNGDLDRRPYMSSLRARSAVRYARLGDLQLTDLARYAVV